MQKFIFVFFLALTLSIVEGPFCFSQSVGINPIGSLPNQTAGLDVDFPTKGILVPRMAAAVRIAIVNPANALLVFDTDSNCFYYYTQSNTSWNSLCKSPTGDRPIISISGGGWSRPADNTGFHIAENYHVNFSDLASTTIQMRFTGETFQVASTNATGTLQLLLNGTPIWTSPTYTNAFNVPFDSGIISFSNPGGLATISLAGEGTTLSGPPTAVGLISYLMTFR